MYSILDKYLPENSEKLVDDLFKKHPIKIIIVGHRNTKHGDFKRIGNGMYQITINCSLNKYQFLLTLIHELAHFVAFKKKKFAKPHGIEWKMAFQHLMLPFLNTSIFPEKLLPYLANYLRNPKASSGSDINLTYMLKQYDDNLDKTFIHDIKNGDNFIYKNRKYQRGNLRRTRFECKDIQNGRTYLFNANAEIELE